MGIETPELRVRITVHVDIFFPTTTCHMVVFCHSPIRATLIHSLTSAHSTLSKSCFQQYEWRQPVAGFSQDAGCPGRNPCRWGSRRRRDAPKLSSAASSIAIDSLATAQWCPPPPSPPLAVLVLSSAACTAREPWRAAHIRRGSTSADPLPRVRGRGAEGGGCGRAYPRCERGGWQPGSAAAVRTAAYSPFVAFAAGPRRRAPPRRRRAAVRPMQPRAASSHAALSPPPARAPP
jgi:hypothetical protein